MQIILVIPVLRQALLLSYLNMNPNFFLVSLFFPIKYTSLFVSCVFGLLRFGYKIQGGSNMTGTDLCVNKPHCAAAVRP